MGLGMSPLSRKSIMKKQLIAVAVLFSLVSGAVYAEQSKHRSESHAKHDNGATSPRRA